MIKRDNSVMPTEQEVEQFLIDYSWMRERIQKIARHLGKGCDSFDYDSASPSSLEIRWETYYGHGDYDKSEEVLPVHYLWTMNDKILLEEKIQKERAQKQAKTLALQNRINTAKEDLRVADARTAAFKKGAEQRLKEAEEALSKLQDSEC